MATAKRTDKNKKVAQNKNDKGSQKRNLIDKNKNNNEIYGIIAITCSLIFMFSLYTNKLGYLSIISKEIFISLLGIAAFFMPILFLYISIKYYFLKQKIVFSRKYWGIVGAIAVTLVLIQTVNMDLYYVKGSIVDSFGKFLVSKSYLHGGFITFILILPLYKLMGNMGIYIICAAAYIICSILIFNYNIRGVAKGVHNKGKDISKKAGNTINKKRNTASKPSNKNQTTITKVNERQNNNVNYNLHDTFTDDQMKGEVNSRIKMINFMNNSPLSKLEDDVEIIDDSILNVANDELIDYDSVVEMTENAKKHVMANNDSRLRNSVIENIEKENKPFINNNSINLKEERLMPFENKELIEEIVDNKGSMKSIESKEEINKKDKDTSFENTDRYDSNKDESKNIVKEKNTESNNLQKKSVELTEQLEDEIQEDHKNEYSFPTADLLNQNSRAEMNDEEKQELLRNANKLEEVLMSFGVQAELLNVTKGPSVTRYEIQPRAGIKVNKIVNLSNDIALGLAAAGEVRIEAPIPGKAAVGIEIPNNKQTPVYFREIIESNEFNDSSFNIACALGKNIEGKSVIADLSTMPHLLIAGATGSGKSVCINTLIVSILYKYSPDEVKLLMVDPKVVELSVYNGIPHLLIPVVTDPKKASGALFWAVKEMDRRYNLFATNGARNIASYNKMADKGKVSERLPYIVIIVDELADLMMVCPGDVEDYICRLAQKARAAGMHLVIATQRPSVDVITGVIKANIPSRISFAVSSQIDSRTILDSTGAEKLLGKGDMLFHPIGKSGMRVQGAFISEEEVEQVVEHVKCIENTIDNNYEAEIVKHMESASSSGKGGGGSDDADELLDEAIRVIVDSGQVSASFIQRRLKIGFNRAARMIEQMEELGVISEKDGNKPRQVLISKDEIENIY